MQYIYIYIYVWQPHHHEDHPMPVFHPASDRLKSTHEIGLESCRHIHHTAALRCSNNTTYNGQSNERTFPMPSMQLNKQTVAAAMSWRLSMTRGAIVTTHCEEETTPDACRTEASSKSVRPKLNTSSCNLPRGSLPRR